MKSERGDNDIVGTDFGAPFGEHHRLMTVLVAGERLPAAAQPGSPGHFAWMNRTLSDLQEKMHRRSDSIPESELPKPLPIREFAERALQIFDQLDVNDNGRVSQVELANCIGDPRFTGKDAQVLAALYRNVIDQDLKAPLPNKLGNAYGVSRDELKALIVEDQSVINDSLRSSLSKTMQDVAESQALATKSLYHDSQNPIASINPLAVRQGGINDCYFEAALSTLAATDPNAILRMIKQEANGSFTVTFPGDRSHPVNVSAQTEAEAGLYNHATRFGMWAGVMEKAYGEYLRKANGWRLVLAPQDELGNGKETAAMKLLTGNNASFFPASRDLDAVLADRNVAQGVVANKIEATLRNKMPLAAATPHQFPSTAEQDWTFDHAHAILAFDRNGKNGGTVLLYDPTGRLRTISMSRFMKTFSDISIGSSQPLIGACKFDKVHVSCAE